MAVSDTSIANLRPPWEPGESGNPNGRPPGKTLLEELREALDDTSCGGVPNPYGWTSAKCLVHAMIMLASKGNSAYGLRIWDQIIGKIPDAEPKPEISMEEAVADVKKKAAKSKSKKK